MDHQRQEKTHRIRTLSVLLDSKYEGPFGIKFGLDALLGLLPVIGDSVTTVLSGYIILEAALLGCPFPILAKMVFNVLLETIVDFVPFLGNLFDFLWKSNRKNMALLDAYIVEPRKTTVQTYIFIGLILIIFLSLVALLAFSGYRFILFISDWISSYGR